MQVTPELLKKYHQQICTEAEREAVEYWLQDNEAIDFTGVSPVNEAHIKAEIWWGIQRRVSKSKPLSFAQRYWHYAAACVVAFILLLQVVPLVSSKTVAVNNTGFTVKTVSLNGVQVNVQPNSRCFITVPFFTNNKASIRFCGAVSIVNHNKPVTLTVVTDGAKCNGKGADRVKLYKGQTYMAMTDSDYNMIAATGKELQDGLPALFSNRLTERFKL